MRYLIAVIVWSAILFPVVAAIYGIVKWRGSWRLAASLPLAALAAFFVPMLRDWTQDPAAHNLWGLLYIPLTMLLSIYCAILILLYRKNTQSQGTAPNA